MLWLFRAFILLGYGAAGVTFVRGVTGLVFREWLSGLRRVGLGLLGALALVPVIALLSSALIRTMAPSDPADKARVLGEAISSQMNYGAIGLPIGLLLGCLIEWRTRRRPVA